MPKKSLFSAGFTLLREELDERVSKIKQQEISFRKRIEQFRDGERHGDRLFANHLREIFELKRQHLTSRRVDDVRPYLDDLEAVWQKEFLYRTERAVAEIGLKAAALTLKVFQAGELTSPARLWLAIENAMEAARGVSWHSVIIEALRREYPANFPPAVTDGKSAAEECRAALLILTRVAASEPVLGGKRLGRPKTLNTPENSRIITAWQTGRFKTYRDAARELGIPELQVKKAVDGSRKRR